MKNFDELKIGCIGCGTMGGALITTMTKIVKSENIFVSSAHFENAQKFAQKINANACESNAEVAKKADILFLGVKPVYVSKVIEEVKSHLNQETVLVSMAAGVTLEKLENSAENFDVIRIMPNMPALCGRAMTALCCKDSVPTEKVKAVTKLLETAGKVENVAENLMDCVTGVSGSGPAFVFMFIEALADAAVRCGMPRKQAYIYAAQTVKGSATMVLEDGRCPAALKDAVCSPAGTTIEGVATLEKLNFRNSVIEAVTAACEKSKALGKK